MHKGLEKVGKKYLSGKTDNVSKSYLVKNGKVLLKYKIECKKIVTFKCV